MRKEEGNKEAAAGGGERRRGRRGGEGEGSLFFRSWRNPNKRGGVVGVARRKEVLFCERRRFNVRLLLR